MDFRKIILDNWGIKVLSIALSITLWFFVTSKGKTELTLTIPIELRDTPQNMAVIGDVTGSMEVRVQGTERVLRDITIGKKVVCIADLSTAKVGENTVQISPDDIRRPSGVTVTHMSLSEIKVKLEPLMRKTLRLKPVLRGNPAVGFHVAKITVSPSKITLEAPAGVIDTFDSMQTMPIDIGGAHEDLTVEPKIDYQGKQVKMLERDITVHITLERTRR